MFSQSRNKKLGTYLPDPEQERSGPTILAPFLSRRHACYKIITWLFNWTPENPSHPFFKANHFPLVSTIYMLHLCPYLPGTKDPTVTAHDHRTYTITALSLSCEQSPKNGNELNQDSVHSVREHIKGYALHAFATSRVKDPP